MFPGDGEAVGRPVSGRAAADGPQLKAAVGSESVAAQDGAADRRVAVHAPVGAASDRVSPAVAPLNGRPGARAVSDAEAREHRPDHRAASAQAQAEAVRGRRTRTAGARRHQETGPYPRRRRVARPRTRIRAAGSIRDKAARAGAAGSRGYRYLHHAVDDHSRVAYSEILDDERKETAAGFWERANAFFAGLGITVTAVMTDNGACYRSHAFADVLGDGVKHKWTKPYRPQTNGKVERFNRTLAAEWAYAKPYASEAERWAVYGEVQLAMATLFGIARPAPQSRTSMTVRAMRGAAGARRQPRRGSIRGGDQLHELWSCPGSSHRSGTVMIT